MLTPRQAELLDFIDRFTREKGYGPSYDEMCAAIGLHSRGAVNRHLNGLVDRGFIRRLAYRSRAIEVLRRPNEGNRTMTREDLIESARVACVRALGREDKDWMLNWLADLAAHGASAGFLRAVPAETKPGKAPPPAPVDVGGGR